MSIADIVILSAALLFVAVLIFVKVRAARGKRKGGCCSRCSCDCTQCVYQAEEKMKNRGI